MNLEAHQITAAGGGRAARIVAKLALTVTIIAATFASMALHWREVSAWYAALPEPVRAAMVTGICTVSSGVIAAGIAFLGVSAANRSSLVRLRVQHQQDSEEAERQRRHDSHEKRADRKGQMRREVYLRAIEKTNAAIVAPARLLEKPFEDRANDDEALQAFLNANAQVRLVCETKAMELSFEVTSLVAEFYMQGVRLGLPFRQQMTYVHKIRADIAQAREALRRLQQQADDLIAQGNRDPQHPTHLAHSERVRIVENLERGRDKILEGLGPLRRQQYLDNDQANLKLQTVLARYQSALREELHLEGNAEAAVASVQEMRRRAHIALGIDLPDTGTQIFSAEE